MSGTFFVYRQGKKNSNIKLKNNSDYAKRKHWGYDRKHLPRY